MRLKRRRSVLKLGPCSVEGHTLERRPKILFGGKTVAGPRNKEYMYSTDTTRKCGAIHRTQKRGEKRNPSLNQ
jgi:hypothetical protein